MTNIIQELEAEQMKQNIPDFSPGDTVVVQVKVKEGARERLQAFEGVVIAIRNRGLNSAFTVRKISHGEGVERVFQTHSPLIAGIKVKRHGDVRQAKLYYLRELTGKKARIKEKLSYNNKEKVKEVAETMVEETPATTEAEQPTTEAPIIEEQAKSVEMVEPPKVSESEQAITEEPSAVEQSAKEKTAADDGSESTDTEKK